MESKLDKRSIVEIVKTTSYVSVGNEKSVEDRSVSFFLLEAVWTHQHFFLTQCWFSTTEKASNPPGIRWSNQSTVLSLADLLLNVDSSSSSLKTAATCWLGAALLLCLSQSLYSKCEEFWSNIRVSVLWKRTPSDQEWVFILSSLTRNWSCRCLI